MRLSQAIVLCTAVLSFFLCGCADNTAPKGPELGSVQAYLDEHPEALIEEEVATEEEEFAASDDE